MTELPAPGGLRVLFASDPRRVGILLIGRDKSPDDPGSPIEQVVRPLHADRR
jgi:hypothetical protein